ncbi:hypothetical protein ACSMFT_03305 [Ectopseudomonas oleovorans]|uniref:hypothetical protein n=1 Tax=Ectopseudomonas oleovorans TaxID=301 RepID=UPI003F1B0E71
MFGLFKRKKKLEQEKRSRLFYQNCITEIEDYINNCSAPTSEDLIKISVNAKITYELFRNVREIQPDARSRLHPLITNGLAVFIEIEHMDEQAALKEMQAITQNTINELVEHRTSELSLPSINAAFAMSRLVGFDQSL